MPTPRRRGPRIIETESDIRDGVRALRRKCRFMRLVHDAAGDPPLRRRPAGFDGLARIIVGQQVSVASASAIWGRLEAALAPLSPRGVLGAGPELLRGCGLSRPKIRTLIAVAEAIESRRLRLDELGSWPDEAVREHLTAVSGIGPWTADVYIMFCLGRADSFAPGDLALQVAAERALQLEGRPSADELSALAEVWRPWRGVAARLLWAYYAAARNSRSLEPV